MSADLNSRAEAKAVTAEALPAFRAVKLIHVKDTVAELLQLIGRDGVFDEYTKHDISHVDAMLASLEWIIPESTQASMSSADWLMSVLSIYFHDLGMLVTRSEFEQRSQSDFPRYKEQVLAGPAGQDYQVKLGLLGVDRSERFLYQEFVRSHHAERIKSWIIGRRHDGLGVAKEAIEQLDALLAGFDPQFRRDLATVCESHHLDDLGDLAKYRISQAYGNSDDETANLQYASILLRTADLLHITRDRTPSVSLAVISPTDPVSQIEWSKQQAVKRVRAKPSVNRDGIVDPTLPKDTVEVQAYFQSPEPFFALTTYLDYCESQLDRSFDWCRRARAQGARHEFPWRVIDDSGIETEGFLPRALEFTLDAPKILDLLTGHTLYNDSTVVLRELVQNSLDAVRLQSQIDGFPLASGRIDITWSSSLRILTVTDNGTGMTGELIERHLLKVGSSRYQDPDFRKQHPHFSPISRFGIGVLSTFMIADSVEFITSSPEESKATHIVLRSVQGKYLARYVEKASSELPGGATARGTKVLMNVRPSVGELDVAEALRKWIMFPGCQVAVSIDDAPPQSIGFDRPRDAVEAVLRDHSELAGWRAKREVREIERDGLTVAFAVEWNDFFNVWSFVTIPRGSGYDEEQDRPPLGTCVEGIRVTVDTPGFEANRLIAIANAQGASAPRTNVARSMIEFTPSFLLRLYSIYAEHIANEIEALHHTREFSLTWATKEGAYLAQGLLDERRTGDAVDPHSRSQALEALPLVLVEEAGLRKAVSMADLRSSGEFWTVEWNLLDYAESLSREAPGNISAASILNAIGEPSYSLPEGPVVRTQSGLGSSVFNSREPHRIQLDIEKRRIDVGWLPIDRVPRWRPLLHEFRRMSREFSLHRRMDSSWREIATGLPYVLAGEAVIQGAGDYAGAKIGLDEYLWGPKKVCAYVIDMFDRAWKERTSEALFAAGIAGSIAAGRQLDKESVERHFGSDVGRRIDHGLLETHIPNRNFVFNRHHWTRKEQDG
jgi:molecular chaperone HtpG